MNDCNLTLIPANQTMSFTPDPEEIQRYVPKRRPYVEVTIAERKIHAEIIGWHGNMILISYPPRMITKFTHGQKDVQWVHKSLAVRIRREDSIWASLEDDYEWHQAQDERITFRPDPWNIYSQEFPEA